MIAGSTFLFLIVTYVGCIEAVDLWFMRRVATRVRDVHADVWSAIGAGSLRAFPFGLFARYRGYQQLNDPTLAGLFRTKRRFDLMTALGFIATFAFLGILGIQVAPLDLTPFSWGLAVAALVGGLYLNSRHWRKFIDEERSRMGGALGADPQGLRALLRQVRPLLKTDPKAAEQLLRARFKPLAERDAAQRERLLRQAPDDPSTARTLYDRLQQDLDTHRSAISELAKHEAADPWAAQVVQQLRGEIAATEQALARVRLLLR